MTMQTTATVFEVLDALGLSQLVKRRGDLGGSMPLRAVRGCAPLFEGNAFGFQITLRHPITLQRNADGMLAVEIEAPYGEALAIGHRAVLPRLAAQGFLPADGVFEKTYADSFIRVEHTVSGTACVHLWTGLCVRTDAGVWLRVSATANRRNRLFEVQEHYMPDNGAFTPLVLRIDVPLNGPHRVCLEGEIGTVAPMAPGARIQEAALAQAPEVGAAHAAFYDEAYFAVKQDEVTQKYRKMKQPPEAMQVAQAAPGEGVAHCRVITLGPAAHTISAQPIACVDFTNLVPFEALYDGHTVAIEPDQAALRAGARAVEHTFAQAMGPTFLGSHPRAMLYFTKYFTPHPPGEPHFFVKPWAFVQTPPGWSCLLEGAHGDGYDVLRGVIATDVFHAVPAVFQVFRLGEPIRVGLAQPLLRVMPIPRRLLEAGFRQAVLRA